jgi:hypothetical protein
MLANAFNGFMRDAAAGRTRARFTLSPSGVTYVFMAAARNESREVRVRELQLRCFVARGQIERAEYRTYPTQAGSFVREPTGVVIGLATERYEKNAGFSIDSVWLEIPTWTALHQEQMLGIQRDLGLFVAPKLSISSIDEYPSEKGNEGIHSTALHPTGRNQFCPCGSGKKYKRCHGRMGTS